MQHSNDQSSPITDANAAQPAQSQATPLASDLQQRSQQDAVIGAGASNSVPMAEKPAPAPPVTDEMAETRAVAEPPQDAISQLQEKPVFDKPLPASPPDTPAVAMTPQRPIPLDTDQPVPILTSQSQPNALATEVSPTPIEDTPVTAQEEQLITDRTPKQEAADDDIQMTDAHPSVPVPLTEAPVTTREEPVAQDSSSPITQVDQLPPPPVAQRQVPATSAVPIQSAAQAALISSTATEAKKALLPALRPEHRGRKCLVLDLDETLVHSSFKVGYLILISAEQLLTTS